jgi:hypothetical protein
VGPSAVEDTSQAVLGSSDQQKVPTSLSLFLKSEKIPALLDEGKGPLSRGPSPIKNIFKKGQGANMVFYFDGPGKNFVTLRNVP